MLVLFHQILYVASLVLTPKLNIEGPRAKNAVTSRDVCKGTQIKSAPICTEDYHFVSNLRKI